jgi:putative ABC transport system substrate-binding protein
LHFSYAQPSKKLWRIGFLVPRRRPESIDDDLLGAFPRGLRELGYVEGRDVVIEWRFADGRVERLAELAEELVRLRVDVLVAGSSQAIGVLQKATSEIPIVMATSGDPVGSGFVASLARPEGNITGLSNLLSDASPKQLQLVLEFVPRLSRVAVLVNPANPVFGTSLRSVQSAAQKLNIDVLPVYTRTAEEIDDAFLKIIQGNAGAVIIASDSLFIQQYRRIADLALKTRMVTVSSSRQYVEVGGLASYGPNLAEQFRRAASYVDKIIKGAKPGELAVEQPTLFELFINSNTAKTLGYSIPPEVRLRADKVL